MPERGNDGRHCIRSREDCLERIGFGGGEAFQRLESRRLRLWRWRRRGGGAGCAVTSAGVVADKAAAAPAACLNRFRRETARGAWRAAPALAAVLVARAVLEERTLAQELPGYRDYAARVRYRLPG